MHSILRSILPKLNSHHQKQKRNLMTPSQIKIRISSLSLLESSLNLHAQTTATLTKLKTRGHNLPSKTDTTDPQSLLSSFSLSSTFFSAVVAGEFNSGKSSFINALIGSGSLLSGPLPTTDQMCIVRTQDGSNSKDALSPVTLISKTQSQTSLDICTYIISHAFGDSNSLLSDLALIDTPGTNAIAELGHEALTKRLLPSADIIIFVTSAERAMSESERQILLKIKHWNKKVIVVLNKIDIIDDDNERDGVIRFVKEKVSGVLGSDVEVFDVSSKLALKSKVSASKEHVPPGLSVNAQNWIDSKFEDLENGLKRVLSEDSKVRNKLLSPLGVIDKIVNESRAALDFRKEDLKNDKNTIKLLTEQMELWNVNMERDNIESGKSVNKIVETLIDDGSDFISNINISELNEIDLVEMNFKKQVVALERFEMSLDSCVNRSIEIMTTKGAIQASAVVSYLGKRPDTVARSGEMIGTVNSSLGGNSGNAGFSKEEIKAVVFKTVGAELKLIDFDAISAKAFNVKKTLYTSSFLLFLGLSSGTLGIIDVFEGLNQYALFASSTTCTITGAILTSTIKKSIRKTWIQEINFKIGGNNTSNKLPTKIQSSLASELTNVKVQISLKIEPYLLYVASEEKSVKRDSDECDRIWMESQKLRAEIVDEGFGSGVGKMFQGGWRSGGGE